MSRKGITRDRTDLMSQTLFKAFLENPDGIQAKYAIAVVADRMALTEHEKGECQSGGRGFTRDAAELARSQESRKITLLEREKLVELWVEYNDRLAKDKLHPLPLKPIYFLAPNE